MDDEALLERMYASRSGDAIRALMAGDCSAQGGDRSAADMALCSHLAFWCAGDASRMDRIFRRSGLMRDKWDSRRGGTTYGAQTIERAIEGCTEFYRPRERRADRPSRPARTSRANDKNMCSTAAPGTDGGGSPDEEAPDFETAPSVEGWFVDARGRLWVRGRDGELARSVTSTAPWVAADLVDVDTGDVRALVRVTVPGGTRERALDREVLLNQSKVIGALAPLGANVSSANAKDVVRYLTDVERRYGWARPPRAKRGAPGVGRRSALGLHALRPGRGRRALRPSPDEAVKARPSWSPRARSRSGWRAWRRRAPRRWRSAASWRRASPPRWCRFWACRPSSSTSGALALRQDADLEGGGQRVGRPHRGADSYFRTFADTPKSIVRAAALLHDIPVIIDELQSKGAVGGQAGKRQVVEDLPLLALARARARGAQQRPHDDAAGSWRCLTIATGEIPIVGSSTQQGAANRTLELCAEPFEDVRAAQAMHHLVSAQHGTAGRAYVAALRRNDAAFYAGQFSSVRDAVCAAAGGHPQADNVALLALADALAQFYVFAPGSDWAACLEGAMLMARWALVNATGADGGDTDVKAIQFVAEWLVRNRLHFESSAEMDRLERWGSVEQYRDRPGFCWWVFSSVLDQALGGANFDRQKTLRRMADEGVLLPGSGRGFTRQKRFGDSRVYCVCVDNAALEAMLERSAGAPPAVAPSQGGGPC